MRIILDENLPLPLKGVFGPLHTVTTVQEIGLSGIANGELLATLEGQFDVFVTADKQLKYQQNLSGRSLAIVELRTNRLPALTALFARIATVVSTAQPGDYVTILLES
jgi:predicted nuclease of predicted toxin-antitoxin system